MSAWRGTREQLIGIALALSLYIGVLLAGHLGVSVFLLFFILLRIGVIAVGVIYALLMPSVRIPKALYLTPFGIYYAHGLADSSGWTSGVIIVETIFLGVLAHVTWYATRLHILRRIGNPKD